MFFPFHVKFNYFSIILYLNIIWIFTKINYIIVSMIGKFNYVRLILWRNHFNRELTGIKLTLKCLWKIFYFAQHKHFFQLKDFIFISWTGDCFVKYEESCKSNDWILKSFLVISIYLTIHLSFTTKAFYWNSKLNGFQKWGILKSRKL